MKALERKKGERDLPSAGLHPKEPQPGAASRSRTCMQGPKGFELYSVAFPGTLIESWIGSGVAETRTGAPTGSSGSEVEGGVERVISSIF